ncbi:hypothetical protein ABMY26_00055 (plasmid) [Azospirillum sp. HJ39]|uniref:hypothetical protein n=1 Tax=Azospirillum sp. HJ39 TaxID=3159496 RepID=UPI00355771EC
MNIYDSVIISDGDHAGNGEIWGIPIHKVEDGPIPDKPFFVVDLCPFDDSPGAIWSFFAQAAALIAYIDPTALELETATTVAGGYNEMLGRMLALRRYDALITGQPDAGALEKRLRRIHGPAMPPVHPVPMAARRTVKAMTSAQTRPLPGLGSGRFVLFAGLNAAGVCGDRFISTLGQIESRHGAPLVAVIVGQDSPLPETREAAVPAFPVHVTVHQIDSPAPEEWAWLLDQAVAVVVPAATSDHIIAAAEAAARGRHVILQGPPEPWAEAQILGPHAQVADLDDAAALASCLRDVLDPSRPALLAAATSDQTELSLDALLEAVEGILNRPPPSEDGNGPLEFDLATYLGSDPSIDSLVVQIERSLPASMVLTVYTPDGESRGLLRPTTRVRPFSAYRVLGQHNKVLCVMSPGTAPDTVVDFVMAVRPSLLLRDGYMLDYWRGRLGKPTLTSLIDRICGRKVNCPVIDAWEHHSMPVTRSFLEPIADGVPRILAHGANLSQRLSAELRRPVSPLPVLPSQWLEDEELTPAFIAMARGRLGIPPGCSLITSFSPPSDLTALEESLWAMHMLRHWGIPVQWHIAAPCAPQVLEKIQTMTERLHLSGAVVCHHEAPTPDMVHQYLIAADVGLQLSKVAFGRFAGALVDCLAAGIPAVANDELASSADAPEDAVLRVSDMLSSLDVALALKRVIESGPVGDRSVRRRAYADKRRTSVYIDSLLSHLA